tara:strand:- start:10 stop:261 length:252 start_codon:yes stop_codon:yes gene_type:complete
MDDLEIWIALGTAVVALLVFVLRWYNKANADGKISLSEIADVLDGADDLIDDVAEKVADAKETALGEKLEEKAKEVKTAIDEK